MEIDYSSKNLTIFLPKAEIVTTTPKASKILFNILQQLLETKWKSNTIFSYGKAHVRTQYIFEQNTIALYTSAYWRKFALSTHFRVIYSSVVKLNRITAPPHAAEKPNQWDFVFAIWKCCLYRVPGIVPFKTLNKLLEIFFVLGIHSSQKKIVV